MIAGDRDGADDDVVNYFDVRWADGYGHVSDAAGSLAVAIEDVCKTVAVQGDAAALATRRIVTGAGPRAVGLVRLDVVTSSGPRTLQYVHAVALPPGTPLDEAGWRRLVARRYGDDPAARIRAAYEAMAATTKEAGRALLAPFTFARADVEAELGPLAAPPADERAGEAPTKATRDKDTRATRAATAIEAPKPPTRRRADAPAAPPPALDAGEPPPGAGPRIAVDDEPVGAPAAGGGARVVRWLALAAVIAGGAAIAVTLARRPPRPDGASATALAAARAELEQARASLAQASADLATRTTELATCQDALARGVEGRLRLELAAVRDQLATATGERDRARSELTRAQGYADSSARELADARAGLERATARAGEQERRADLLHEHAVRLCRKLGPSRCRPEDVPR